MNTMDTELANMDAAALVEAYRQRRLSPVEAISDALARIDRFL